ncbi:MAG: ShlB/FhaC/HecB family hemolysin secretion/activation protein [Burkholderiales bacterium]|nr:ShlB/FhaC/HecB family hemolysin secretion/activation protein [Burkholderiales bacterium]
MMLHSAPATAQPLVPPTVDPGQIERRLGEPRRPEVSPVPEVRQPVDVPPPVEDASRFVLAALRIDGASVYGTAELLPLYEEFLSREIGYRELQEIARRITAKYRGDGYILSRAVVPEQSVEAGTVRLRVVEGFIDAVRIEGRTFGDDAVLWRYLEKIRASRPLRAADLERYLLLANDLPGMSARVLLSASPDVQGASDLTLLVQQSRADGYAGVDNRGTRYVGPYQFQGGAGLNSLQGRTRFRGVLGSQTDELRFGELSQDIPLGAEGAQLTVSGRRILSEPGFTLAPLQFQSNSTSGDVVLSYPAIRSRRENLRLSGTFGYRDSETTVLGTAFSRDRSSVLRFGGAYDYVDRYLGINQVEFELSRGLNILGATRTGSSGLSRSNGRSDFSKATFQAGRLQRLTTGWDLLASASGQVADGPLLVSEEFPVGGGSYGRAYDSSEIAGDAGISAKLELRYSLSPALFSGPLRSAQVFGFYDAGRIWNRAPTAGEQRDASLASAGLGARMALREGVFVSLELAFPLTRPVAALGGNGSNPRVFFSLTKSFSKGAGL